ncbi:MAG: ABC-type transport auxiliary lipoprotein family protein, partial [Thermodesulfobacteriota bacterium]|nr:ABC-type transport auxiliary lipoprotein family protein [Thermodesulfobacteriota bacterium]
MNRFAHTALAACALAFLCLAYGCFGGSGPAEKYLRLSLETQNAREQAQTADGDGRLVLAVKELAGLPALDRTAVLLADGPVLTPSTTWYWEGTPADVLTQALVHGLSRSSTYRVVWPYRPRVSRKAQVSGRVLSFEVHPGGERFFTLAFHLDLWDAQGKIWLAGKTFQGKQETQGLSAKTVAEAASQAVSSAVRDAVGWLESQAEK